MNKNLTSADPMLARVVQHVNDEICSHREGDLLCPDCSVRVLDLAHRTVGTALGMSDAVRARAYVRLALEEAESVVQDDEAESVVWDDEAGRITEARRVTAAWLDGEATSGEVRAAADGAIYTTHAFNAAAYAANAAAYAVVAVNAAASAAYAANAADNAAIASANAANFAAAAADGAGRLERAHRLIDRFEALTGVRGQAPAPEVTVAAIAAMAELSV